MRITYLTDFPPSELIAKTKSLPERSIVLYVWQQALNEQGKVLESADVLAFDSPGQRRSRSTGCSAIMSGEESLGVMFIPPKSSASRVAEIALRIANGERAQDIPVESAPTVPMFDWRQLQRWGISEDKLPPRQ